MAIGRDDENRQFSVTLPARVTARIDRLAAARGHSRAGIVREAVLDWLSRQPPERPYDPTDDADVEQG